MNGLREELARLMEDANIRREMNAALIREATQGNKAGSVIRAYELITELQEEGRKKLEEAIEAGENADLTGWTDEELAKLEAELEAELKAEQAPAAPAEQEQQSPFDNLVSVEEAARLAGTSESAVRKACRNLDSALVHKYGKTWILTRKAVEKIVKNRCKAGGKTEEKENAGRNTETA